MQTGQTAWKRMPSAILVIAPIITATLAFVRAARLPLWRDEMATFAFSSLPLGDLQSAVSHVDLVLAPYYYLIHLFRVIPGDLILRIPSVLAATLAVGLLARTVAKTWGVQLGFLAAASLALNPLFIIMSATARPYALTTLGVVSALWGLLNYLEKQRQRYAIVFGVSFLLAVLLHPFSVLALPAWLASARRDSQTARVALWAAPAVVTFMLIALAARAQSGQLSWLSDVSVIRSLGVLINGLSYQPAAAPTVLSSASALAVLGLMILGVLTTLRELMKGRVDAGRTRLFTTALLLALAPWVLLNAYSVLVAPILRSAYLTASTPGFAILIAIGLDSSRNTLVASALTPPHLRLAKLTLVAVATVAMVAPALRLTCQTQWQDDFRTLAGTLTTTAKVGDDIVVQERPYERGVSAGIAHYADDGDFMTSILGSLVVGDMSVLSARSVVSDRPFATAARASQILGRRTVFLIHSGRVSISDLEQVGAYSICRKSPLISLDNDFGQVAMTVYECR